MPGLLLDARNARLRADAAEADEVAFVIVHREEPEALTEGALRVIRRVRLGVTPAERPLGLVGGQLPRLHGGVSRAA